MGNEASTPIDESIPPQTLSSRSLDAAAEYIKSGKVKKIVVLSGAGISTSAGIPDFRSPETGLYANLDKLNLPFAEAVFDINFFRQTPEPFYRLAHELYPGKFRPTITHCFIRLLHDKGLLLKHFTQNIDCLDREAGVPADKIVEAHGSFATQSCIECKAPYPDEDIRKHVEDCSVPHCHACGGLVKPNIVFFGEALPVEFFQSRSLMGEADLTLVMGSSLTVQPFASLPSLTPDDVPRLLINKDRAGDLGSRADDVLLLGECDEQVRELAKACGWLDELEELWSSTSPRTGSAPAAAVDQVKDQKQTLEDEVDKLTKEIDESLRLSKLHEEKTRQEVDANNSRLDKLQSNDSRQDLTEGRSAMTSDKATAQAEPDTTSKTDTADGNSDKPKM